MLCCTKCWTPLPLYAVENGSLSVCTSCGSFIEAFVFPALVREGETLTAERLQLTDGAATCFFHASRRADVACAHCGRFLCALCSLELGEIVLCSECLSRGLTNKSVTAVETRRVLWDSIALATAVVPLVGLFLVYFWIFTAPAAIFLSLRYWGRPGSLLPRTRIRFLIAVAIALLEILLWVAMAYSIFISLQKVKG